MIFQWTAEHEIAKDALAQALLHSPTLAYPDLQQPFCVFTDASDVAIGGALTQYDTTQQEDKPIQFVSQKLSPAETHYSIHERELLAIIISLCQFCKYLYRCHFYLFIDNNTVQHLLNKPDPSSCLSQ